MRGGHMKRAVRVAAIAALIAGAIAIPATPAYAEPCGASSWLNWLGSTQFVGYRNCGSVTIYRKAHIKKRTSVTSGVGASRSGATEDLKSCSKSRYSAWSPGASSFVEPT